MLMYELLYKVNFQVSFMLKGNIKFYG